MKQQFLLLVSLMSLITSCGTVQFHKGTDATQTSSVRQEHWQHIGALGLWAWSDPVELDSSCREGTWQKVQMERTWLQSLISLSYIYTPATITVECQKASTKREDSSNAPEDAEQNDRDSSSPPLQQ